MSVRTHSPTPILKYGRGTLLRFIDMAMPGETLDITIELIQPIKITEEEPFIIRDDECTVGLGRVATIIE